MKKVVVKLVKKVAVERGYEMWKTNIYGIYVHKISEDEMPDNINDVYGDYKNDLFIVYQSREDEELITPIEHIFVSEKNEKYDWDELLNDYCI